MEVLVGRAARLAALVGVAKSEAAHLAGVRDGLEGIVQRSVAINAAAQLRCAFLVPRLGRLLCEDRDAGLAIDWAPPLSSLDHTIHVLPATGLV